ncbi:hypothetical protein IAR50_002750 [Cryptococcus sp. DSM 104548]
MTDSASGHRYTFNITYLHALHAGERVHFYLSFTDSGILVPVMSDDVKHEHELKHQLKSDIPLRMRVCEGRFRGDYDYEKLMDHTFREAASDKSCQGFFDQGDTSMEILVGTTDEIDYHCAASQEATTNASSPCNSTRALPRLPVEPLTRSDSNASTFAVVDHPQSTRNPQSPELRARQSEVKIASQLEYYRRQALDLQYQLEAQEALVNDVLASASRQKYLFRIHRSGVEDEQASLKVLREMPDELGVRTWAMTRWGSGLLDKEQWELEVMGGLGFEEWRAVELASDKKTISNKRQDVPEVYLMFGPRGVNRPELQQQQTQITASPEPPVHHNTAEVLRARPRSLAVPVINTPIDSAISSPNILQSTSHLRVADIPTISTTHAPQSAASPSVVSSPPSYRSRTSPALSELSAASSYFYSNNDQPCRRRIASPSPSPSMYRAAVAASRFNRPPTGTPSLSGSTPGPLSGRQQASTTSPTLAVPFSPWTSMSNSASSLESSTSDILLTTPTSPSNKFHHQAPPTPSPAPIYHEAISNARLLEKLEKLGPMMDDVQQVAAWTKIHEAMVYHPSVGFCAPPESPPESLNPRQSGRSEIMAGSPASLSPTAAQRPKGPRECSGRVKLEAQPLPFRGAVGGRAVVEDDSRLVHRPPQGYPSASSRGISI